MQSDVMCLWLWNFDESDVLELGVSPCTCTCLAPGYQYTLRKMYSDSMVSQTVFMAVANLSVVAM